MKYLVNAIEFDFSDSQGELDEWEQDQIVKNNIGVWEADDEDDLIDEISSVTGWCIKSIDSVSYTHLTLPTICSV